MHSYRIAGLDVASSLPLPGLIASAGCGVPDVLIHAGAVPDAVDDVEAAGPNWQLARDRLLIEIPDIVRMFLIEGRELRFAIADGASPEDAAIFLSGTGFGLLLHQRGRIVLHASAVRVGESAVLFCGASGAGKSTLAAALGEAGYPLVTDDFCSLTLRGGLAWAEPDARQHKLWRDAIDRLALDARTGPAVRPALEKYHVSPRTGCRAPLPVSAVYALHEVRPPAAPGIGRPNLVDATRILCDNAYRPAMVRHMRQQPAYFEAAASIVRSAGVFTLTRQLDFGAMPEVVAWLERHWAERVLPECAA